MEQNNLSDPLLSIVIPTRNRMPYAISTIKSILKIPSSELELVVQDNSDTRELETFVRSLTGELRLRYNYTALPFSIIDNFNQAVKLATGKYVCLIGDDDSVNPEIMTAAQWARDNTVDAVIQPLLASYFWPDVKLHPSLRNPAGKLFIKDFSCRVAYPNVEDELRKLAHNGGQGYQELGLPKIYHGLVAKKCLEQIRSLTGNYFNGLSPDIYGSVAVSHFVDRVVTIDYPLTVGGTAGNSASGDSMAGKHECRLEDAPLFRARENYQWSDIIPRFYSVETIWAESAIVALRTTNRNDLVREFNLPLLYAMCCASHPNLAGLILHDMYPVFRTAHKDRILGSLQFARSLLTRQCLQALATNQRVRVIFNSSRGVRAIKERARLKLLGSIAEYDGLRNTEEAVYALSQHLRSIGRKFENCHI